MPETKDVVMPDGTINGYRLDAECKTDMHIYVEGTAVVVALAAADGSKRWEQAMELEELDEVIEALKQARQVIVKRKYSHG